MTEKTDRNDCPFRVLPEYEAIMEGLRSRGYGTGWVLALVDPNDFGACFLKKGKPGYIAECPFYEGFWLLGGHGSVQCSNHSGLLPGIHHGCFCAKGYENCPYYQSNCAAGGGKELCGDAAPL